MKKKIFCVITIIFIATIAVWNINQNEEEIAPSELMLSNIEALAQSETSKDFEERTGCRAIWENKNCRGKDGKTHSYAEPKS